MKLTSTGLSWWCAALAVVATVASTGFLLAELPADGVTVAQTQFGHLLGLLLIAVMAALSMTAEYRFGTIDATFQAVPNPASALVAKVFVVGAFAGVTGLAAAFGSWGLASVLRPGVALAIDQGAEWGRLFGVGPVYFLVAAIGISVGALVRRPARAIGVLAGWLLVFEWWLGGLASAAGAPVGLSPFALSDALLRFPAQRPWAPVLLIVEVASLVWLATIIAARRAR
ncbi:hypothetical protein [Actinoalloteichus hymeniacidonis]|uniref:hypothetical protein n=1 Tax=Actinoalloteichus hymeniacidonis TaxID=340345 RepID=UPI0012FC14C4|nr:hypothetical protein [Actinoalloteichus hymeniacidonis]MBB5905871.1 ABC-2 type transport system permease protein [Actinoalloteichus hymeniacidonis]